jgi:hypothetical protein
MSASPAFNGRLIIAGTRTVPETDEFVQLVDETVTKVFGGILVTEVVSGCARGGDRVGEMWAERHGIPIKRFPADWNTYGRAAGPRRNNEMADYVFPGGALIAIYDGKSPGTRNMIANMRQRGLDVHTIYTDGTFP